MPKYLTLRNGRRLRLNSPEEDARITAAALSDPDALPVTEEEWEAAKPFIRVGRPKSMYRKLPTTLRLDADVLNAFRSTGPGWQTRMNAALKDWLKEHPVSTE